MQDDNWDSSEFRRGKKAGIEYCLAEVEKFILSNNSAKYNSLQAREACKIIVGSFRSYAAALKKILEKM